MFYQVYLGLLPCHFTGTLTQGHAVARLVEVLRRKVAGSIPDGVIEIFHGHNLSRNTMALGLTQPLTEMSTCIISWGGEDSRCVGLGTLPPSFADCHEIWEPHSSGTLRACPVL